LREMVVSASATLAPVTRVLARLAGPARRRRS
jgi:hypothetical protein